mgnify:CR=1 FL=1
MNDIIYEERIGDHTIKIIHDHDPENPRDWSNLGTMVCGHSRYNLGDDNRFSSARDFLLDLLGLDQVCDMAVEALETCAEKQAVILPVYLYDHSGLAMNTTGFHCPWDSGQLGYIYATLETIREEYGVRRVAAALREKVVQVLKQEVDIYGDYLSGNVYGYVVEKDEDVIDSCWGFIGDYDGYVLEEARAVVA